LPAPCWRNACRGDGEAGEGGVVEGEHAAL
jgi:nicotinamidase-related amidase